MPYFDTDIDVLIGSIWKRHVPPHYIMGNGYYAVHFLFVAKNLLFPYKTLPFIHMDILDNALS